MTITRRMKRTDPPYSPSPSLSPSTSTSSSTATSSLSSSTSRCASISPPPTPPQVPPFKRVSTDIGPAAAGAQEALRKVRRALADTVSYRGLLLLNIPATANKAVKRMVASVAPGPTYKHHIVGPYPDANDIEHVVAVLGAGLAQHATLYITISQAKPETSSFHAGVQALAEKINAARPDVKLVFAACGLASSLKSEEALPELEVRDIRSIPWDFTAESERLRIARVFTQAQYDVSPARASLLLAGLLPASTQAVVHQAKILGKRRHDAGEPQNPEQDLADLADAVESLYARTGKRPKKAEGDFSYIQAFLRPDLKHDSVSAAVAGLPETIKQFILTIKRAAALRGVVPKVKRTMLLKGPPGTGKTTVARALAAELGYPVLAPKSSAFVNEYIGQSANNIYKFFDQARAYADMRGTPVVIFFDEIDALLKKRSGEAQSGEREYDRIVNAFLESLEGIDGGTDDRLIVIGATNFAGTLDNAGFDRFSVKAELALPSADLLQQIYRLHLAQRQHRLTDADIAQAAEVSVGLSGRHVVHILDKAGILAFESHPSEAATAIACIEATHVREAVRIISSESETASIQAFLKQPQAAVPLDAILAHVPKEIGRFTRMLSQFDGLQRVVPDANRSLLLSGPPGTGKTTLARAMANLLQLPMIAPNAGALMGKFQGESAEHVHRLFAQARVYARAHDTQVLIFLDDLDAFLADRSEGGSEHRALVGAFLENMRGIDPKENERLIFVGATNAAGDLDAAVRDRFHLRVRLERPEGAHMRQIFTIHLRGRHHDVTQEQLRALTGLARGFSGRRIVEAINKAGYIAQEAAGPGADPCIDAAALRAGIIEEGRQREDGERPPPEHMYT